MNLTPRHEAAARPRVETGSASILVAVLFTGLLAFVALISDGRYLIAQRHHAQQVATQAARAAAQEIDPGTLAIDHRIVLRSRDASAAATRVVDAELPGGSLSVTIDTDRVTVHVNQTIRLPMMALLGVNARTIEAEGTARAVAGVNEAE